MNLPLLIARRTAKTKSSTQNTMTIIASIAVAVSCAVMVITASVVKGFKKQITSTIEDISADITITDLSTIYGAETRPVEHNESLSNSLANTEGIESLTPYAMRSCIIRSEQGTAGIVIKGVVNFDNRDAIAQSVIEGSVPQIGKQRRKELLIAEDVATKLNIGVGERIELLQLGTEAFPERETMKVCGTYHPIGSFPVSVAITDIRNVQKSNGWDDQTVSGYEITVAEGYDNDEVTDRLNTALFEQYDGSANLSAITAQELYSNIFAWLETHNINERVITIIMFIVALFNMITALLIMLFERTKMVGVLKSLGMNNSKIREIFLYQAATIVGRGIAIGNAFAIVLLLIQKYTGAIKLDATAYFVNQVPVSINIGDILIINTIFAAAILALLFAASAIVSRIEPSEAVKYE